MERQPQANDRGSPVDGGAHNLLGAALHECAGYVFGEKSKITEAVTTYGPETLYAGALLFPGGKALAASAALGALNEIRTDDSLQEAVSDAILGSVKGGATKFAFDKIGKVEFTKSILNAPVKGIVMGSTSTFLDSGLSRKTYDLDGKFDFDTGVDNTIRSVISPQAMAVNAATFGFAGGTSAALNKLSSGFIARSPGLTTMLAGATFGIAAGGIGEASKQAATGDGFDIGKIASESAIHGALYGLAAVPAGLKVGFKPAEAEPPHDRASQGKAQFESVTEDKVSDKTPKTIPTPKQTEAIPLTKQIEAAPTTEQTKTVPITEQTKAKEPLQIFVSRDFTSTIDEVEPTRMIATDRLGQTTEIHRLTEDGAAMPQWQIYNPSGATFSVHAEVKVNRDSSIKVSGHSIEWSMPAEEIISAFMIKPDITSGINRQLSQIGEILAPLSDPSTSSASRNQIFSAIHDFIGTHRSPNLEAAIRELLPSLPVESKRILSRYYDDPVKERARQSNFLRDTAFQMMREGEIEPSIISDITALPDTVEKSNRLSEEQKQATLKNVLELLDDGNDPKRTQTERLIVPPGNYRTAAIQAAMHVNDPDTITQFAHPTCALASLEVAAYIRAPDKATKLISDVLKTGRFTTTDGTEIRVDPFSLQPELGSLNIDDVALNGHWSQSQYRSYASQVFQTTAANIYWQTRTVNPDGESVPVGSLRYELRFHPDKGADSTPVGYIVDYGSSSQPKLWEANGYHQDQIKEISNLISEKINFNYVPERVFVDEGRFSRFLAHTSTADLPISIGVDARYLSADLADEPHALLHRINILGSFDPVQPGGKDKWLVAIKNPWNGRADYIPVSKLYEMAYMRYGFLGPHGQDSQENQFVSRDNFMRATATGQ